jgi:membrane AbrB-like protein
MNQMISLGIYLALGLVGGLLGSRLKITGGTILGAMLAVIIYKVWADKPGPVPREYTLVVQILIGVMAGSTYTPEIGRMLLKIAIPIMVSTLVLVVAGLLTSLLLARMGVLNAATAYLGTSPGAMSALISLAADSEANPAVVAAFHFVRVVFILVTAPLIFYLMRVWFPEGILK